MSARGVLLSILVLLAVLLSVPFFAHAQGCQTIFLPDGRMVICCTSGSVTTCF